MTLDDLIKIDFTGKNLLVLGRPSAGKTWLSKVLGGMYKHHTIINTDDYIYIGGVRAIAAIIEDQSSTPPCIIEGMMGYDLLLTGAREKSYSPDIVIEVDISTGRQMEIYLSERDPAKIKYLKKFEFAHLEMMNEYHRIVPAEQKPQFITLSNTW